MDHYKRKIPNPQISNVKKVGNTEEPSDDRG